jgi:hypothetical protein
MSISQQHLIVSPRVRLRPLPRWARGDRAAVVILLIIGIVSMARQWDGKILWDPDSLFYQAKVVEIRTGESQAQALRQVFNGPLSAYMRSLEATQPRSEPRLLADPRWPTFSAQFYARRLLVPALAAAIYPVFGLRSLKLLSLVGYVLLGPLLYALMRQRFRRRISLLAATVCLLLPPVRNWASFPLTDTWSLALEVAALIAAVRVIGGGGRRWLIAWVATLLASSITHDAAFLPVVAVGVAFLCRRSRQRLILLISGIAACVPAMLISPANENVQLATAFSQHAVPGHTDWSWVLSHYLPNVGHMLHADASYAVNHLATGVPFALGLVLMLALALRHRRDPVFQLLLGVLAGYLLLLALGPSYSVFRYELVLEPVLAGGFALGLERAREWAAAQVFLPRLAHESHSDLKFM